MIRLLFYIPLLFLASVCNSELAAQSDQQQWIEMDEVALPNGDVDLYAINKAHCPLTLYLDFPQLVNYKPQSKIPMEVVLKKSDEKQFVVKLKRGQSNKEAGYGFSTRYTLGDGTIEVPASNYVYQLPFPEGKSYIMGQGYNGRFSHQGIYAVDFDMKEGTPVSAARGGTVALVKSDSKTGCKSSRCQDDANFILIHHEDGTFGHYGHLKFKGVKVRPGDQVKTGDIIGYSGNTGMSSGPHLHFEVYYTRGLEHHTLPVKFQIDKDKIGELKENASYISIKPSNP